MMNNFEEDNIQTTGPTQTEETIEAAQIDTPEEKENTQSSDLKNIRRVPTTKTEGSVTLKYSPRDITLGTCTNSTEI